MGSLMAASGIGAASGQLFQEYLGLLQVGGVQALDEPAVDQDQEFMCFGARVLLPQLAQTHRRPQLSGLRLPTAGNDEGLLKTGFGLGHI
jgi:hypothetical protein